MRKANVFWSTINLILLCALIGAWADHDKQILQIVDASVLAWKEDALLWQKRAEMAESNAERMKVFAEKWKSHLKNIVQNYTLCDKDLQRNLQHVVSMWEDEK